MDMPLYLDYAATTPLDPRVLAAMLPFMESGFSGNAHARHHAHGGRAHRVVETARQQVADTLSVRSGHIIFTSGATVGNNLVIQGVVPALRKSGRTHIITSAVEHKSVLDPLASLDGFTVTILPVKSCGMVDGRDLERALTPQTGLVSIQAVNNELGTIQPLEEFSAILQGKDIFFHVDAAQAFGKIPLDMARIQADFVTLSSHKAYGPQGIGAVYQKTDCLSPLLRGGGQERSIRAGTLPVFLCAGFGVACTLLEDERARLQDLRDMFLKQISGLEPVIGGHGDPSWNVPSILNLRFCGIDQESLVMALPEISFGTGSACLCGPSHVMAAVTGSDQAGAEAIRLSFGRFTTIEEMQGAASLLRNAVTGIRTMQQEAS